MQSNESIIGKAAGFVASTFNNKVTGAKAKYVDGFNITTNGLSDATAETTAANALGLVNPIQVNVGGVPQITTRIVDLYALNLLAFQHIPVFMAAGTLDNDEWILEGLWMPAWWPPTLAETTVSATFNAVTGSDNTELTITAEYLDRRQRKPALYYNEQELNTSGVDSTAFGNGSFTINTIGDLIGVLFFSTTIAGGIVLLEDATIQQFRLTAGGRILGIWMWSEVSGLPNMFGGQPRGVAAEELTRDQTLNENYIWFPLTREPIPRGTQVVIDIMAGVDASTMRILPMQAIRLNKGLG